MLLVAWHRLGRYGLQLHAVIFIASYGHMKPGLMMAEPGLRSASTDAQLQCVQYQSPLWLVLRQHCGSTSILPVGFTLGWQLQHALILQGCSC